MILRRFWRNVVRLIRVLWHRKVCSGQKRVQDTSGNSRTIGGGRWKWAHLLWLKGLRIRKRLHGRRIRQQSVLKLLLLLRLFLPAPFLFQLFVHKTDPPASFLPNLFEDLKDFFLLAPRGKTLRSDSKRAYGDTSNAPGDDM